MKRLIGGRRWIAVPVALVAAAGFATTSGALNRESHAERVCANLDAKEVRQQAALAQATPESRRFFNIEANIAQTERQEANHGCGD
jgi:hypothetical protein